MPNRLKNERIAIYFDIILGIVISVTSLYCVIFFTLTEGIKNFSIFYVLGILFLLGWLGLSIFFLVIGIKSYYNEKYFELTGKNKKQREIRAPMVS